MGKWFCIWQFSDNRKINLNLEPKPAVVPERRNIKKPQEIEVFFGLKPT
jgi:hypothetical protein